MTFCLGYFQSLAAGTRQTLDLSFSFILGRLNYSGRRIDLCKSVLAHLKTLRTVALSSSFEKCLLVWLSFEAYSLA